MEISLWWKKAILYWYEAFVLCVFQVASLLVSIEPERRNAPKSAQANRHTSRLARRELRVSSCFTRLTTDPSIVFKIFENHSIQIMVKKNGKKGDPEKTAALAARKEAKAEKEKERARRGGGRSETVNQVALVDGVAPRAMR